MTMTASTSVGGDEEDPPPPPSAALGVVVRGVDGGGEGDGGVAPEPNGNGPAAQAPDENPEANGKGGGGGSDEEDGVAFVGDVVAPPDDDGRGDGAPEKGAEEGAPRPPPPATGPAKRNLNSYYGHKIGAYQTISLLLNAGLMLYAHLGLSAVILTSQDPTLTEAASANAEAGADGAGGGSGSAADQDVSEGSAEAAGDGGADQANGTIASLVGSGRCNPRDLELWLEGGGESNRLVATDFCSHSYDGSLIPSDGGGCYLGGALDEACVAACFQEEYGFSYGCAACFAEAAECAAEGEGCASACATDGLGEECKKCHEPCVEALGTCTGLPADVAPSDEAVTMEASVAASAGKCDASDREVWIADGGDATRAERSNFCSREFNGGCFLDGGCIEECFQEEHGYSAECSTCFGGIPRCSIASSCMMVCAADSLGPECAKCNEPCVVEVGACTGLPSLEEIEEIVAAAVAAEEDAATGDVNDEVPSQPPPPPGECSTRDREIWIADGGASKRPERSNHCSRTYNGGCFLNSTCISECFQEVQGYSPECAICFGEIPSCSVRNGCTMVCAADSLGEECRNCNKPCIVELDLCTGLPDVNANDNQFQINDTDTDADGTLPPDASAGAPAGATTEGNSCNQFDLGAIDKWYTAYNLTFVRSVRDAWTGDAKLLAVIIVIFSGIWPYLKNIMLVMIWYIPASVETQTDTLLWLSRLSKYTLVDVFSVIGVLVGVQLQLNVGGTEAVTRAEPRFGIIAFFLATVWEFLQIELIKAMHERKVLAGTNESGRERLLFPKLWTPVLILVTSLALYIFGAVTEIVYFSSADYGSAGVCKRSYNLVTLGNALINEHSMTGNSAKGQTWILYLSYVVLNLAFPIITHLLQICFIAGWFRSKILKRLIEWTLAIWCFACIEVLLIGIFAVEYKFPNLIMRIAGDTNAGFLDIDSQLGVGFYILIAYSIVAGLLQNSLRIRHAEAYLE